MVNARQLPNAITVLRIFLVLPTAWLLWHRRYPEALVLMAVAGASDGVDGWLARRLDAVSRFGEALDPVADKLLVVIMVVIFTVQEELPVWLAVVIIARDLIIVGGALTYRTLFGRIEFAPTFVSKANTAMQIVTLLGLLLALCGFGWLSELARTLVDPWCFLILAVLGISSGVDYVVTWSLRAWRASRTGR